MPSVLWAVFRFQQCHVSLLAYQHLLLSSKHSWFIIRYWVIIWGEHERLDRSIQWWRFTQSYKFEPRSDESKWEDGVSALFIQRLLTHLFVIFFKMWKQVLMDWICHNMVQFTCLTKLTSLMSHSISLYTSMWCDWCDPVARLSLV